MSESNINRLVGKTLRRVAVGDKKDVIVFEDTDGKFYAMFHKQDCCESVLVEDVCGDLQDLIDSPILRAEESTNDKDPEGHNHNRAFPPESVLWTFYRLTTAKGQVVIRWRGESNGYYSESVTFTETTEPMEHRQ